MKYFYFILILKNYYHKRINQNTYKKILKLYSCKSSNNRNKDIYFSIKIIANLKIISEKVIQSESSINKLIRIEIDQIFNHLFTNAMI